MKQHLFWIEKTTNKEQNEDGNKNKFIQIEYEKVMPKKNNNIIFIAESYEHDDDAHKEG